MGILKSNLEVWDNYRLKRNLTSNTYNEKVAQEVASVIEDFANETKYLYESIKEKLV